MLFVKYFTRYIPVTVSIALPGCSHYLLPLSEVLAILPFAHSALFTLSCLSCKQMIYQINQQIASYFTMPKDDSTSIIWDTKIWRFHWSCSLTFAFTKFSVFIVICQFVIHCCPYFCHPVFSSLCSSKILSITFSLKNRQGKEEASCRWITWITWDRTVCELYELFQLLILPGAPHLMIC